MNTTIQRHAWSEKVAYAHHSDRVCWNCALIKRTRHEHNQHWIEFYRGNERIRCERTPPCPGAPAIHQPANTAREAR